MSYKKYDNKKADFNISSMLLMLKLSYSEGDPSYSDMFDTNKERSTEDFFYSKKHIDFFNEYNNNDWILGNTIQYLVYLVLDKILCDVFNFNCCYIPYSSNFQKARRLYYKAIDNIYNDLKSDKYSFDDIMKDKVTIRF